MKSNSSGIGSDEKATIDSSVIIASLLENEPRHGEALRIWEPILEGTNVAIMPYSVFVEVAAAIRRRTGSEELAIEVKSELLDIENVSFVALDQKAAEEAADIAIQIQISNLMQCFLPMYLPIASLGNEPARSYCIRKMIFFDDGDKKVYTLS